MSDIDKQARYAELLQSLLPPGRAFNRTANPWSVLGGLLHILAGELARADDAADSLFSEALPSTAATTIALHEQDLGLPDICLQYYSFLTRDLAQRRIQAVEKYIRAGSMLPAVYEQLVEDLYGIVTAKVFEYGEWKETTLLTSVFQWVLMMIYQDRPQPILFAAGTGKAGDALQYVPADKPVACLVEDQKPAHTQDFIISGNAFDQAFSPHEFNALRLQMGAFSPAFTTAFDCIPGGYSDVDYAYWFGFDPGPDHDPDIHGYLARKFGTAFSPAFAKAMDIGAFSEAFDDAFRIHNAGLWIPWRGSMDPQAFSFAFNRT